VEFAVAEKEPPVELHCLYVPEGLQTNSLGGDPHFPLMLHWSVYWLGQVWEHVPEQEIVQHLDNPHPFIQTWLAQELH